MEIKRIGTIQVFEFLLCLFVIFIHISSEGVSVGNKTGLFSGILFFLNRSLSFVVPAFIFASALKLTIRFKDTKITLDYYIRRVAKIYIPYVIWVAIYYFYFVAVNHSDFSLCVLAAYVFDGTLAAHFYFIVIIMQFYIMMPIFLSFAKKVPVLAGIVVSFALMYAYRFFLPANTHMFSLLPADRWFLGYLVFWMLGVYCALNFEAFCDFLRTHKRWILSGCGAVFLPHLWLSYAGYIGAYNYRVYEPVQIVFCVVMMCGFYLFCMVYLERYHKLFHRVEKVTYFVFLSHILVLLAVEHFLINPQDWLVYRFLLKMVLVYTVPFAGAFIYAVLKKKLTELFNSKGTGRKNIYYC